jgi:dTDP-4-amino-4,6-dideoxygalactose transaminase
MSNDGRIYLSVADISRIEENSVFECLQSGWISTVGPDVVSFEEEIRALALRGYGVALASGTAALHLGYKSMHILEDDEVVIPTITFGATAFPITYLGAKPIFLDADPNTLTLEPDLLEEFLRTRRKENRMEILAITRHSECCQEILRFRFCVMRLRH